MVNKLPLLAILVLLISITPGLALWETVTVDTWLSKNNNELVEGLNVRVVSIDVNEKEAEVIITNSNKKTVFQGTITTEGGYEGSKLKVRAADFRYKDAANEQVKLELEMWVDANIKNINFPEKIYKTDSYKVFAVVENNANEPATFIVELSAPENMHVRNSNKDQSPDYVDRPKNVVPSKQQKITVDAGKTKKAYFEIQTLSKEGAVLSPTFKLLTLSGVLVDEVKVMNVAVTNNLVGYIEDLVFGNTMISGREEIITVKVRNSWIGMADDFRVKLIAPEFEVNLEQQLIRAYPRATEEVLFRAVPFGGGAFTVIAELRVGTKLVDTLTRDVNVLGDKIYKIIDVEAPKSVRHDRQGIVFVSVENNGVTSTTLALELTSKEFRIPNSEAVMKLNPGADTRVLFNIEPLLKSGSGKIDINLYSTPESYKTSLYKKQDKLIDSKTVRINVQGEIVIDPEEEEEVEVEVEVVEEVEETVEEVIEPTEVVEVPPTKQVSVVSIEDYWPYLIVLVLVVLAIIIIATSGDKKAKIEIYDIEKKKDKKSRKRKKNK